MDPAEAAQIITAFINSGELDVPDAVPRAAGVFADACKALNDRLAVCDNCLNAHQRSEAIRQATLDPDILKQYTALDIQDWRQWVDTARHLGLPVPPRLNDTIARRVHGAFAAEYKVKPLLEQLRRFALERAPLLHRLAVLRRLAAAEPTNLVWADDVRAHEKARFSEIRDLLNDPDQAQDLKVLTALQKELDEPWLSAKPPDIVQKLNKLYAKLQQHVGQDVLRDLYPKLEEALEDHEPARVRLLHEQVRDAAKKYALPANDRAWGLLREAEEWLDRDRHRRKRRQQFDAAVADVRSALAKAEDWADTTERYEKLETFGEFDVPSDVAQAYAAWGRARRLKWVGLGAGAVVAVLFGVALYFFALAR